MAKEDVVCMLFSCPIVSDSLQPPGLQHARPPCPSPSSGVCPSSCLLHQWCRPAISSSDALFSFALSLSQHQGLFQWVIFSYQMTKILELQLQSFSEYSGLISLKIDWFDFLADFQESSPAPQLEGINSLVFCLLYNPAFTTIHDHWYADETTLTAESEEELKSLLMRVKEDSERAGLRLNIKKKKKPPRSWHPAPLLHGK